MDIVWLKRDVRLHDHGPLAEVAKSRNSFAILYLYESDQLAEPTVHGSHLQFIQEGLVNLDHLLGGIDDSTSEQKSGRFRHLTVCHATMISTLQAIQEKYQRIGRILAHEETGHWKSFMRDKDVRKWCQERKIPMIEYKQTGVARCLKRRDDYSKMFKEFIAKPRHATPNVVDLCRLLVVLSDLPGHMPHFRLDTISFNEIHSDHRGDRPQRQQRGGETRALATLNSFLKERGSGFSQGISSPNTSWTSCSRLSPYLSWGHVSLRHVVFSLHQRQEKLRQMKQQGHNIGPWLRSLGAFSSRLHWRSHFIQKLETEPELEKRDLCSSYQHLRRQPGDWNEVYYQAWATGKTGFPFVDACMRCLLEHGWLNFRMRAMLISFATYNLWLDWKRLAPHMARVFLDFEPGIHYSQLQMQAGTTGINAMRVYNVTKQGKDQDPEGTFIRKFVKELAHVPKQYIHEPWKMPLSAQQACGTIITASPSDVRSSIDMSLYPSPIVNEQESAKSAKAKIAAVRKLDETRALATKVYQKHGSRNRQRAELNGKKLKALSAVVEGDKPTSQQKLTDHFSPKSSADCKSNAATSIDESMNARSPSIAQHSNARDERRPNQKRASDAAMLPSLPWTYSSDKKQKNFEPAKSNSWNCKACTFLNEGPLGLACSMCRTPKS